MPKKTHKIENYLNPFVPGTMRLTMISIILTN